MIAIELGLFNSQGEFRTFWYTLSLLSFAYHFTKETLVSLIISRGPNDHNPPYEKANKTA